MSASLLVWTLYSNFCSQDELCLSHWQGPCLAPEGSWQSANLRALPYQSPGGSSGTLCRSMRQYLVDEDEVPCVDLYSHLQCCRLRALDGHFQRQILLHGPP